jgi:hypothetical protein
MEIGFSPAPMTVESSSGIYKRAMCNSSYKAIRAALIALRRAQAELASRRAVKIGWRRSGAINLFRNHVSIIGPERENLKFREKIFVGEFEWRTREEWMSLFCALYSICVALIELIGWVGE